MPTKIVVFIFCAVFLFIVIGAFISPCDKPDVRTKCRNEIASIRDLLRNRNLYMEACFVDWRTNLINQCDTALAEQMSQYCWETIKQSGIKAFNFQAREGVLHLIDPWGEDYNIAETNKLPILRRYKYVGDWNVGPFIVWSSGPNRKNEFGAGDDIVGFRKR